RAALRSDALRAAVLTGALFVPSVLAVRWSETFTPGAAGTTLATALSAAAVAGLAGTGARALGGRRDRWAALATGAGAGILLAWWFG
ncbi:MAG: hypothetical protein R3266_08945, partial [Gemmatimonadota bacterium]|nr:hypothetical protein [Gemmatimonadota bacterium]